jgi:hypothetical protein
MVAGEPQTLLARARRRAIRSFERDPDGRGCGETDQADQERGLTAEHSADPPAQREQAPERQRIGGHDSLAVAV